MSYQRNSTVYLDDILESIAKIKEYTQAVSEEEFYRDTKIQDSIIRRLEIMGEAVKNIPEDVKRLNPRIPWREIAGMRDFLIHDYFGVNLERVWEVVEKDLRKLEDQISNLKKRLTD